ncbi:hypothetical protein ANCCEY_01878 [Ancylostoma ceylanicum]|uniref:SET domain-containing protein n=1 Tax=Ancylostoma ceylanicum TaxID=53326 RepID=A0A0D6M9A8_9BILA|nr:hypothetical protein ANCCEY_01878 [Ancylostoma ceylanicum]
MLITQGRKVIHEWVPDLSNGSERFPVRVVNDVDTTRMIDFVYTTRIVDRNGVLAARRNTVVTSHAPGFARESSLEWPFVECSAACTCSLQCGNRVAQKGATYPIEGERLFTVDARLYGNFTRFINHSCRPNATVCLALMLR